MSTAQIQALRNAITNRPPFCSGTVPVPVSDLNLFYSTDTETRCIHFPTATADQLQILYESCDPATFGRNNEDVLDESYRKARKLDAERFAASFDLHASGLLQLLSDQLIDGAKADVVLRAERYKINVYGRDEFFKAHKDTPRGADMFGSLVLIFPTEHKGGALVLRDDGKEWSFDSASATQSQNGSPCMAYVAFYSDVEHEVTKVTSGYRVTLTYNLYRVLPSAVEQPLKKTTSPMEILLRKLLSDESFLLEGGNIGFGLEREYPLPLADGAVSLEPYKKLLKGADVDILQVCSQLGLRVNLNLWYDVEYRGYDDDDSEYHDGILCGFIPDYPRGQFDDDDFCEYLADVKHGERVQSVFDDADADDADADDADADDAGVDDAIVDDVVSIQDTTPQNSNEDSTSNNNYDKRKKQSITSVHWVTPPKARKGYRSPYIAYGNQAVLTWEYGHLCLVVRIGPYGQRQTAAP